MKNHVLFLLLTVFFLTMVQTQHSAGTLDPTFGVDVVMTVAPLSDVFLESKDIITQTNGKW